MKFSNGTVVDLTNKSQSDKSAVGQQPLLLDAEMVPASAKPLTGGSVEEPVVTPLARIEVASLENTIRDEVTGVELAAPVVARQAHSIVLHGQSAQGNPVSASLALSSTALDEVTDIYLRQAQAYCEEKQWKKAFQACQEILKVSPQAAEAYKLLGKVLQQQGKVTDSMGFYAKALTLQPHYPEVYSNLGSLYAKKQQWEDAVAYYQKAIEQDPSFAMAYFNLAKVWKRLGDHEREQNCLTAALRLQPDLGTAAQHYRIAQSFEQRSDKESAIVFYRHVVTKEPARVEVHQRLADLLEESGDWQGAATCYRQVLTLNMATEKAKTEKAKIENRSVLGGGKAAQGGQLARIAPDQNQQAQNQQAQNQQLQTQQPQQVPVRLSEADRLRVQQLVQASSQKKLLRPIARAIAPESSSIEVSANGSAVAAAPTGTSLVEQAYYYEKAQDWPRAISAFRQAIQQAPRSAQLYRGLAQSFGNNGQPAQSAEAWYRSFVLDPKWPTVEQCYALGRVLRRQGNMEAATRCFQQAVEMQSSFSPAHKALNDIERSQSSSMVKK